MGRPFSLDAATIDLMLQEYQADHSINSSQLALKYGVGIHAVRRMLRSRGVAMRRGAVRGIKQRIEDALEGIYAEYNTGRSLADIAVQYDCSESYLYRLFERNGLAVRNSVGPSKSRGLQDATDEQLAELKARYESGEVISDLAKAYGVSQFTVHKTLKALGVTTRRPGPVICPVRQRNTRLKRQYGITAEDYDRLFEQQNGVCAICGCIPDDPRNNRNAVLCVDHCHTTGKVRGLLCHMCNQGLGAFEDSPELFNRAARYLQP